MISIGGIFKGRDFFYFSTLIISGLTSFASIYLFKDNFTDEIFANYFESTVIFSTLLIFLEFGGFTKIQMKISTEKYFTEKINIIYSVVLFSFFLFFSASLYIYFYMNHLFDFFQFNISVYLNFMWVASSLNIEKKYSFILFIKKVIILISIFILIMDYPYNSIILSIINLLFFSSILFLKNLSIRKIDLLVLYKTNKFVGISNFISNVGNRLLDFYILNNYSVGLISLIGYVKSILDKLQSIVTNHIINRNIILNIKNLTYKYFIKNFLTILIFVIVACLIFMNLDNDKLQIDDEYLIYMSVLILLVSLNAIVIRLIFLINREKKTIPINILIYSLILSICYFIFPKTNYFIILIFIGSLKLLLNSLILIQNKNSIQKVLNI
tara:strand:+ start:265 stop:1413 length:1149 start_codon:yes stop_codon:yes gene_type:complete